MGSIYHPYLDSKDHSQEEKGLARGARRLFEPWENRLMRGNSGSRPRPSARLCTLLIQIMPLSSVVGARPKGAYFLNSLITCSHTLSATETTTTDPPSIRMRSDSPQMERARAPEFLNVNCGRSDVG